MIILHVFSIFQTGNKISISIFHIISITHVYATVYFFMENQTICNISDQLCLDNPDDIKQCLKHLTERVLSDSCKLYTNDMDEEQIWAQMKLIQQPLLFHIEHELENFEPIVTFPNIEEKIPTDHSDNNIDPENVNDASDASSVTSTEIYYDDFYDTKEDLDTAYKRALEYADNQLESDFSNDDEQDNTDPSTFEKFQQKMNRQIEELEKENISEKPWTMTGEVSSKERPINSLLEEVVDFDILTKPAPMITEQVTNDLEQRIQKRIYDELWDDPQKPVFDIKSTKPLPELSAEKSKKSLSQIYEEEYHPPTSTKEGDANMTKELWKKLSRQLDTLSHFYHVPKETKKVSNDHDKDTPALMLEETIPMFVSDSQIRAPEQTYAPMSKPLKAISEQSSIERHRQHLNKKKQQRRNAPKMANTKTQLLKSLSKQKNVTVLK